MKFYMYKTGEDNSFIDGSRWNCNLCIERFSTVSDARAHFITHVMLGDTAEQDERIVKYGGERYPHARTIEDIK